MKTAFLVLFGALFAAVQAQVKGKIIDNLGKPVSYASIGVVGKAIGTLSNEDGSFELLLRDDLAKDSIRISAIGYHTITFSVPDFRLKSAEIRLENAPVELEEVKIKSKKIKFTYLGNKDYTKNNCSGFVKNSDNWKGSEAAILAGNKAGRYVKLESFSFYVIQNKYADSLLFRLMFYETADTKYQYPKQKTFLRKPIIFKVGIKQGEFTLDLSSYNITTSSDFYISLECLMDEMDISKFCYAGSYGTPSFVKSSAFERWTRVRGGGGDFNVKVSYVVKQ